MNDNRRRTFSAGQADEIRALLADLPGATRAEERLVGARLRRIGFISSRQDISGLTPTAFDDLVASGALAIDADGDSARALVSPHPSGNIFRVAVGVTGHPVDATWSAFDSRYQWFGKAPKNVTSGAHLFVLAVDQWRSAVVGLYETVSAGADKLAGSPDPDRWPWALGVRPLAAVPPPVAVRVEGQTGPQSGLPERVYDASVWPELYAAVASSPPPPGPETLEQRVQELEWEDVADDVLAAVQALGSRARRPEVIERAIELGGWSDTELAARAWYTGGGESSHIRSIVGTALSREHTLTQRLERLTGGRYIVRGGGESQPAWGVPYRPAASNEATVPDDAPHLVDVSGLDAATSRHMSLQDELAADLRGRGIEPLSPGTWQPQFDIAFEHAQDDMSSRSRAVLQ